MILWSDKAEAKRCRGVAARLEREAAADKLDKRPQAAANKLRRAKEWREKAEALDPTPKA